MNKKYLLIFGVAAPLLSLVMVGGLLIYLVNWEYPGPPQDFTIKAGEGFASVNYRLSKKKIITTTSSLKHELT